MHLTFKTYKIFLIKNIIKKIPMIFITSSNQILFNQKKFYKENNFITFRINKSLFRNLLSKTIFKSVSNQLLGSVSLLYSKVLFSKLLNNFKLFFSGKSLIFYLLLKNKLYSSSQIFNLSNFKFSKSILKLKNFLKLKLKSLPLTFFRNNVI